MESTKVKEMNEKQTDEKINRREALTRATCMTLSATTMMLLIKSQPAMATSIDTPSMPAPPTTPTSGQTWQRTTRS